MRGIDMQKRKWTQQEEEILIRLYEDPKVFPKDIAKMLGRALQQVYNKARAMGLKAHNSFADISATEKCYWELKNRGLI